jgi:hypothetical protein
MEHTRLPSSTNASARLSASFAAVVSSAPICTPSVLTPAS